MKGGERTFDWLYDSQNDLDKRYSGKDLVRNVEITLPNFFP